MAGFTSIVDRCDNFSFFDHREELTLFCLAGDEASLNAPIGLLWPEIVSALRDDHQLALTESRPSPWVFVESASKRVTHVYFSDAFNSRTSRSQALATTCMRWHNEGLFAETIGGRQWRDELYPVYADPFRGQTPEGIVCEIERAAAALFGLVTYGVHMTIFQRPAPGSDGEVMTWVPTRAKTKQTWPGYLDNTVAGGIPAGMSPFESLVKESMEEASIAEEIVRKHARSVGSASYFFQKGRWLQPEVEYVYDLEIPVGLTGGDFESFRPKPLDGEVEAFEFLPVNEVIARMQAGRFKPNCALVLLDFLIRHGFVTSENEPDFLDIVTRMHGRFNYESWAY